MSPSGSNSQSEASSPSRALIQFTFPKSVLISPLWPSIRIGCANGHLGIVFVLSPFRTPTPGNKKPPDVCEIADESKGDRFKSQTMISFVSSEGSKLRISTILVCSFIVHIAGYTLGYGVLNTGCGRTLLTIIKACSFHDIKESKAFQQTWQQEKHELNFPLWNGLEHHHHQQHDGRAYGRQQSP